MSSGRVRKAIALTCFFMAGYGRHKKLGVGFCTAGYGRHRSQWDNNNNNNKYQQNVFCKVSPVRLLLICTVQQRSEKLLSRLKTFALLSLILIHVYLNCDKQF